MKQCKNNRVCIYLKNINLRVFFFGLFILRPIHYNITHYIVADRLHIITCSLMRRIIFPCVIWWLLQKLFQCTQENYKSIYRVQVVANQRMSMLLNHGGMSVQVC